MTNLRGGEKGDNADIYIKSINGDRPLRITSDPAIDMIPTWSPDAQRIAFVRFTPVDYKFTVFVASTLGTAPERMLFSLNSELATLSWSPDGKYIAAAESFGRKKPSHIVLFSPETGEKRNLTTPPLQYWADSTPAFSPDKLCTKILKSHPRQWVDSFRSFLHETLNSGIWNPTNGSWWIVQVLF